MVATLRTFVARGRHWESCSQSLEGWVQPAQLQGQRGVSALSLVLDVCILPIQPVRASEVSEGREGGMVPRARSLLQPSPARFVPRARARLCSVRRAAKGSKGEIPLPGPEAALDENTVIT